MCSTWGWAASTTRARCVRPRAGASPRSASRPGTSRRSSIGSTRRWRPAERRCEQAAAVTRPNDVGGSDGCGPVDDRTDDVVFHEPWERQVFGLTMGFAATGRASDATIRDAVDRMAPGHYLSATYWERWLTGLATILVDQGVTTAQEL